jgi:two-component system sensor histidine kinase/response regulator
MTPFDFDPNLKKADLEEWGRKLIAGEAIAFESQHRRKDGTVFPVEIRGQGFWEGGRCVTVDLARDISDRKRSEETLRASEQRWRNLAEALPQFVWTASADGTADYFSTQIVEYTGLAENELLAWGWMDVLHQDDRERTRNSWIDAIAEERNHEVEHRIRSSDGRYRWFTTRGVPIRDTAGQIVKWFGTCTDINEHKRSEQALTESEQRWRSLTETLPQLVWTATPDGACDYFSMQWTQFTGVPENHLLGWQWMEVLHPDDRERTRQFWTDSVAGRGPYDVEYRVRRLDGEYRWFKTRGVPIRDSGGDVYQWFGTCTDISDAKQLEEELRQANARLDLAVRGGNVAVWEFHLPDGIFRNGSAILLNHWAQLGYEPPEGPVPTSEWIALVHPEDWDRVESAIQACLDGTEAEYKAEFRMRHRDASYRWVLSRGVVVRDAVGKPIRFTGIRVDISELKRAEEELRHAKGAAESANRAKDEFLANVSHEIRTPMNAILGMTELVLDTPLTEDQRQSLKTVKAAADNLLGIINDLLDFSKIEAGKLELDPDDFSLRSALGDTLRTLAMRAHRKGLELISHVQPDVPDALVGDPGRLRQVLLNLVGNAIKFTEEGDVLVRVECVSESRPDGEVGLLFSVTDTGIGIPPDKHEAIFRAFEQEDTSTTRKFGGTGLGLTIASRLVALMGGTISVDSQPGRGSKFTFTASFRLQSQFSEPLYAQPPISLHDLPVLIVDDNETNRHILKEWMHGWKMEPTAVGDGVAAMDALWKGATNERPFALVLLDGRMPDTDGLALAARIRERTARSATRIILLTSGDRPDDAARSYQLGIDARLLKPVRQEELLETIYRVMSRTNGDAPPVAGPAPVPISIQCQDQASVSLRILVAEDNEFNAQLLDQLLTRRGHRVRLAINGREALHVASEESFDLLLLDIHMPELDGFQVIQTIREQERAAGGHLPVIALTARSRNEDRDKCLAAGMDDFLAKPIQAAALWDAIGRIVISKAPTQAASGTPIADEKSGLVDARVLLAACGNDDAILRNICAVFRDRVPNHIQAAQDALRDRDAPRLREAAHKLCGMIAAFSSIAGATASHLEDHAAGGRLEDCQFLVEQLDELARELIQQVEGLSIETLQSRAAIVAVPQPPALNP